MRKAVKLERCRVRRNYLGGINLDRVAGVKNPCVSDRPEQWVSSITRAVNPGLEPVEDEGLSCYEDETGAHTLLSLISSDPDSYLGAGYYRSRGLDLGFLVKILDSGMRLHVQAHPSKEFAQKYLSSRYGKLECYYILDTGDSDEGYLRLGFQHLESPEQWRRIVETQDIPAMDALFDEIPVHKGEVWYIPAGMPHAIGKNITMIEIMEPSDLVVRCEFSREGVVVPPEGRFMNRGLDFCMDIFDFRNYSVQEIRRKCMLERVPVREGVFQLVGSERTSSFAVFLHEGGRSSRLCGEYAAAVIVTEGCFRIKSGESEIELGLWESAFIPAGQKPEISGDGIMLEIDSVL